MRLYMEGRDEKKEGILCIFNIMYKLWMYQMDGMEGEKLWDDLSVFFFGLVCNLQCLNV